MGTCSPDEPFTFDLGAVSSRGAIGAYCNVATRLGVTSETHDVTVEGPAQPNFFATEDFPYEDYENSMNMCGIAINIVDF